MFKSHFLIHSVNLMNNVESMIALGLVDSVGQECHGLWKEEFLFC